MERSLMQPDDYMQIWFAVIQVYYKYFLFLLFDMHVSCVHKCLCCIFNRSLSSSFRISALRWREKKKLKTHSDALLSFLLSFVWKSNAHSHSLLCVSGVCMYTTQNTLLTCLAYIYVSIYVYCIPYLQSVFIFTSVYVFYNDKSKVFLSAA